MNKKKNINYKYARNLANKNSRRRMIPSMLDAENRRLICCNSILRQTSLLKNSLLGYEEDNSLDNQLKCSFIDIKNTFEEQKEPISFISFADTELSGNNLDKWKVDLDKGKFFYAAINNTIDKDNINNDSPAINDYYFLKEVLAETETQWPEGMSGEEIKLLSKPRSAQLAYVLEQSFVYRIYADKIDELNLDYEREDRVLTVKVPINWFDFSQSNKNTSSPERNYSDIFFDETTYQYRSSKDQPKKQVWGYESNKASIEVLQNNIKIISEKLRKNNVPIKEPMTNGQVDNDVYANGFSRLILSLAYLSKLKKCWVESIPSIVAIMKGKERCLGVFIWGYYGNVSPYSQYFQLFADKLCTCYASKYIKPIKYAKQVYIEAVKSAKAAIMSRNVSHNLGSHVMFYIKQQLESFENMAKNDVLMNLAKDKYINNSEVITTIQKNGSTNEPIPLNPDSYKIEVKSNTEMPFLTGLGRFFNYLQERQDYIATVATDYIPSKSVVNFKDSIYDELKPELRAFRHQSDTSVRKVSNLLLDYIAFSEGFKKSDNIKLFWGKDFNGTQDVPDSLRECNVALPGGTMGRQAFFSIMENLIRNTAKHEGQISNTARQEGTCLNFYFSELGANDILSEGLCYSNKKVYENIDVAKTYIDNSCDYYYLGITIDAGHQIDNVPKGIIDGLNRDYLVQSDDTSGMMDEDYKGIKEIRISAAWIRGFWIDTAIPNDNPPAVAVRIVKDENDFHSLQYIICLPRPKRVAIITDSWIDDEELEDGCKVFDKENRTVDTFNEIADYNLVVYVKPKSTQQNELCQENSDVYTQEANGNDMICEEWQTHVGSRFYIVEKEKVNDCIINCQSKEGIGELYKDWLKNEFGKEFGEELPKLIINDSKSSEKKIILDLEDDIVWHDKDQDSDQLVYSKHYSGQSDIKEHYVHALFLEGISGGNSTDRLIRREKWTKEWYAKQMTAALTKIAIFDERIYSKFFDKGWDQDEFDNWIEKQGEFVDYYKFENLIKEKYRSDLSVESISLLFDKTERKYEDGSEYVGYFASKDSEKRKNFHNEMSKWKPRDYSIAKVYQDKGIWAFDIDVEENKVFFIGYDKNEDKIVKFAELYKENDEPKCDYLVSVKFHFITIHQGILDKIYKALDCDDDKKKKAVTEKIFKNFTLSQYEPLSNGFLPHFVIHSGRSKPSKKDMPQQQPFLQFSAIDHAVRDCKYTLTELLYSAHYEQSNNNN